MLSQAGFLEQPLSVSSYYLFDVGIVDANDDGILDIYTSNHTARPSLLLGDGRGNFFDVYHDWELDQQKEFPGLEDSNAGLVTSAENGVFIYWDRRRMIIKASYQSKPIIISGQLTFDSPAEIVSQKDWEYAVKQYPLADDLVGTQVNFKLRSTHKEGLLVLQPALAAVPFTFCFDSRVPLSEIFIGAQMKHPHSHTFKLMLKDRHGLAWADWNGDDRMDVFISQGSLSGKSKYFPDLNSYELYARQEGIFVDVTSQAGVIKNECRARQASWVDMDRDNLLDLFVSGTWSPNQLFKQNQNGQFLDVAKKSGLADTENGLSAWFDADKDSDVDLFIAGRDTFVLYLNQSGYFRRIVLGANPGAAGSNESEDPHYGRPTISDFDGDGDVDIYVASLNGSTMIINEGGHFGLKDPQIFGLPSKAVTANWVDIDNDGHPDLHTVPDGIFRQSRRHKFIETRILALEEEDTLVDARCSWFDVDNDGYRDVIVSVLDKNARDHREWSSKFFRNQGTDNYWLEIQLVGPPGNREAIGASAVVQLKGGRRLAQQVGEAEGSHYSQGHYRLYFGLGKIENPKSISILWPDGLKQRLEKPKSDRLLFFHWDDLSPVPN